MSFHVVKTLWRTSIEYAICLLEFRQFSRTYYNDHSNCRLYNIQFEFIYSKQEHSKKRLYWFFSLNKSRNAKLRFLLIWIQFTHQMLSQKHKSCSVNPFTYLLTYNVKKCEKLTKEVSISPPIMIFQIIVQIIKKKFFLLFLFYFRYYADV